MWHRSLVSSSLESSSLVTLVSFIMGYEKSLDCLLETTVTASVAWDGSCVSLLLRNTDSKWRIGSFAIANKFGNLYVELLIEAAEIGLFMATQSLKTSSLQWRQIHKAA